MYCKLIFVGRCGNEPELKFTPTGKAVCTFSLAVNRQWRDDSGEKHEETTWLRCEVWGKQAETVNEYLRKGRQVLVEGDRIAA